MGPAELVWLILLAVAFWFLLIRPQRKRQMEMLATQRGIEVGDEVMTHAGYFGRVTAELDDPAAGDCLMLEVAPGTEIKIARGAVLRVVSEPLDDDLDDDLDRDDHDAEHGVALDTETPGLTEPTDDHHRSN